MELRLRMLSGAMAISRGLYFGEIFRVCRFPMIVRFQGIVPRGRGTVTREPTKLSRSATQALTLVVLHVGAVSSIRLRRTVVDRDPYHAASRACEYVELRALSPCPTMRSSARASDAHDPAPRRQKDGDVDHKHVAACKSGGRNRAACERAYALGMALFARRSSSHSEHKGE
jgi:hypothetical protein